MHPPQNPERIGEARVAEYCLQLLLRQGILNKPLKAVPWDVYRRLEAKVHAHFVVPGTTLTRQAAHLLFAIAYQLQAGVIVGAGTYVGYCFSWLLRDALDADAGRPPCFAIGFDVDKAANRQARSNCQVLGHEHKLIFKTCDAFVGIQSLKRKIQLLYIDVDSPEDGKRKYRTILEAALPHLAPGAVIIAHDPCVALFKDDFEAFHSFIRSQPSLTAPLILPVDECGMTITAQA